MSEEQLTPEQRTEIYNHPRNISLRAYPEDFLIKICKKIGIEDTDKQKRFIHGIRHAGERYLTLIKANQRRLQPNQQNALLNEYKTTLEKALEKHREICQSSATSGKLFKALREIYNDLDDEGMRRMFEPYCNSSGIAEGIFENFLDTLAHAAEKAKKEYVGNDKADLSGLFLTQWIAAIGKRWKKDATMKIALGRYYKETGAYAITVIFL
ncbi:MAG: hypothetical protein H3C49_09475 [Alphaproteobacteria bacterium]|nr:hypothetical protein [Alphaproteobacteria bacterium]